ncbi:hypothetical protein G4Y79_23735 [Phototrophicus methaneseepsis]|uniref:Terpene synthase n=1 Tax=Phototrophicus methaneseepsis TaxID=2710758 RepID=A0A7S8IEK3_9CHLR|nr:hypothetical protein [Phototrophicus methaneseepsis]QPC82662.1 hypothetical protein G4Y79_23735 [Phototrophicus methaneseepsis]
MDAKTTRLMSLSDVCKIGPKAVNPHADEAQARSKQICEQAGIYIPSFENYTTMSGYLYPEASMERLVVLITVTNMLYYADEVYERHARQDPDPAEDARLRALFEQTIEGIITGEVPHEDEPLYRGALAIHKAMTPLTHISWVKKLIPALVEHLNSTTYKLEDILQKEGGDPLERYIALRELDGGMRPTIRMIEFANDFYLTDELRSHPFIQSIEAPTVSVGGLLNDIFSYEKEVLAYDSRFNLVAVFEDYYDLPFEHAVHKAVEVVNNHIAAFLALEQSIPVWEDPKTNEIVRRYVKGLRDQIKAAWYWQLSTDRYRSKTSPFPELRMT